MQNKDPENNIYKKRKKIKKENEKVANPELGNFENLGNLGNIIPSFLISKFSILPYCQYRKLGFKNLGFSTWPFHDDYFYKSDLLKFE